MSRKIACFATALVVLLTSRLTFSQQHAPASELDQYVEQASELASRARANVYFANFQSIFRGVQISFVNVGTGNLTFMRRDMVASGRIPIVFARVFDSNGKGSTDFGPGWSLSAAESITLNGDKAHLVSENGATIDFVKTGKSEFQLEKDYPSDYSIVRLIDENTLEAKLRTGFIKQFQNIEGVFRLVRVADRNGNEIRLVYSNGLLQRIVGANHSITILRNPKGRIIVAQDDKDRSVHFEYDKAGCLASVRDLGGNLWAYGYNGKNQLLEAKDPLQRLNFSVGYDSNGRVRLLQLPSGAIRFEFDSTAHVTTVSDRKNLVSRFFQNEDGITVRATNPLGEETAVALDGARNVISLARDGVVTERMEYDAQHRLTVRHTITTSGTVNHEYRYDAVQGLLSAIHSDSGEDQVFSYDKNGNLTSAILPDGERKFKFSDRGDLVAASAHGKDVTFSPSSDGLFASMANAAGATTKMKYKAGGQLEEALFPGDMKGSFEYQASGLRARLSMSDGQHTEYAYDPAGNLTASSVFNSKGEQINGQKMEMDTSYQLSRWTLFDGTVTDFKYDGNGNLTEIRKGKSLTRFGYDSVNRLTTVVTPKGRLLTYSYKPGERSLVEQHQHAALLIADVRDSGLTFASPLQVLATRPITGIGGATRFSESLGSFQLADSSSEAVVRPHELFEAALKKLFLFDSSMSEAALRSGFNIPFNSMFIPSEYVTINCCPECYYGEDGWYCPPCYEPPPPPVPADSRITSTVSSSVLARGQSPCMANFGGWQRVVDKVTVDQYGADFPVGGQILNEAVTISTPNDLNISGVSTGTAVTNSAGGFRDTFFVCSSVCPSSAGQTVAFQTLTDQWPGVGLFLLNTNTLSYKCTGITVNGQ